MYDWNDPFTRMFLQILAVIAEFEANPIRQRTREGMDIARQNGKLRGKQPVLKPALDREIRRMHDSGDCNVGEIAALFSVSRPTVYRSLERTTALPALPDDRAVGPSGAPPLRRLPPSVASPCGLAVLTRLLAGAVHRQAGRLTAGVRGWGLAPGSVWRCHTATAGQRRLACRSKAAKPSRTISLANSGLESIGFTCMRSLSQA